MLIECRYWMASPMLFMISDASGAVRWETERKAQDVLLGLMTQRTQSPPKQPQAPYMHHPR